MFKCIRRWRNDARRLFGDRRGSAVPLVAIVFPLLIACAGLAVDVTEWTLAKRQLQGATDSAAMAGVYSLVQESDAADGVDGYLANATWLDPRRSVEVDSPVPGRETDPFAVAVRLAAPVRLTFAGMFLRHGLTVSAAATATVVKNGKFCAFALGEDDDAGLVVRSGSDLQGDCGIAANASSADSLKIEDGARVEIAPLVAHGGIQGGIGGRSHALRVDDPLEDTEPPLVPTSGCPNMTVNADSHRTLVLNPGCYGNLVLNGSVRLMDGEYILNRGSLVIGPTADVTCDACTIFLTSDDPTSEPGSIGRVEMQETATVNLSAPTEGANAGIVIYQDRHAISGAGPNIIGGSGFSKIRGLIYTPSGILDLRATHGPDVRCARFIGSKLIIQGRIYIAASCSGSQRVNFLGTEVKLVG